MRIPNLEKKLSDAKERLKQAAQALAPKHRGGEWEEFKTARAEVLAIERELALEKGEEHAVTIDFPVRWCPGAPLPHLFVSDCQAFLVFYIDTSDPDWDGTYVTVRNPANDSVEPIALVEFYHCESAKMGTPNDEVFSGHPLFGRGLEGYTAQMVHNSRWLIELEAINKIHDNYDPDYWQALKHYVFWFHDSTLECVAKSYQVEVFHESMSNVLAEICKRLLE